MKSIVYVPRIQPDTVTALSALCDKASMVSTGWEVIYIKVHQLWFFNISSLQFWVSHHQTISTFFFFFCCIQTPILLGLSCCPNSIHWIYTSPTRCNISFLPLQQCRNCGIKAKCNGKTHQFTFKNLSIFVYIYLENCYTTGWFSLPRHLNCITVV